MTALLSNTEQSRPAVETTAPVDYTAEQIGLLKRTIAKGVTDDELMLFLNQCRRTRLDPFSRQIHAVKRWDAKEGREVMTIQVGIDGLRLVADRTGCYCPGRQPSFTLDKDGLLESATSYVLKLVSGTWLEVAATAFYDEYVQTTKEGQPTAFWRRMPRGMLSKCAEALALRRAFPMELSGILADEEVGVGEEEADPSRPARGVALTSTSAAATSASSTEAEPDEERPSKTVGMLQYWDRKLVAEGLSHPGEFFPDYLCKLDSCPSDIDDPAQPQRVKEWAEAHYHRFRGARLDAKKGTPRPDEKGDAWESPETKP